MSANAFRDFLTYHVAADRTLVVDLSELEFMGTCGLSVLSVLSTRSRDVGGTLALVCARPVQRLHQSSWSGVDVCLLRVAGSCNRTRRDPTFPGLIPPFRR
ncbi:STAS domain-containing protein [Rhodococcus erythropolis]|uniref:STAS domain-containing protein n=1 Tax=Rhodococcus erythropolis TaxID=1833 RepID=UPI003F674BCF